MTDVCLFCLCAITLPRPDERAGRVALPVCVPCWEEFQGLPRAERRAISLEVSRQLAASKLAEGVLRLSIEFRELIDLSKVRRG